MEVSLQSFRKRFTYDPQKDLLGKGGFGEVYKAYDNEDQHYVALKISQGTADDKYNLVNEVKRFKKLRHPNIVKHIEAYEVNTGSTDIHGKPILYHVGILEYADKGTLADLLIKGTPDYRVIEDLAKDIIEGLAYLHSENIIHRDLKPTNILLFSEGEKLRAKITDFGIAKRADATTASTQLVGTVEYMAPEYFTTGNITPTSDVWSLGVMLLEALTGAHPFGKTSQGISNEQIIANILNKDISTAAQNLLAPFKETITRCLLRETNVRPQSANELKGLLQQKGDAFSEKTQVIDTKFRKATLAKPKRKWLFLVILLLLFLLPVIGYIVYQKYQTSNSKNATTEKPSFDPTKPFQALVNGKWVTVTPADTTSVTKADSSYLFPSFPANSDKSKPKTQHQDDRSQSDKSQIKTSKSPINEENNQWNGFDFLDAGELEIREYLKKNRVASEVESHFVSNSPLKILSWIEVERDVKVAVYFDKRGLAFMTIYFCLDQSTLDALKKFLSGYINRVSSTEWSGNNSLGRPIKVVYFEDGGMHGFKILNDFSTD